jgi:Glutaredoxin-like domain (DUF836)
MRELVLYTTLGCHLCEQALALVTPLLAADDCLRQVDVSDSDGLIERYGIRIPVIARIDTEAEIGWPFDGPEFQEFLR